MAGKKKIPIKHWSHSSLMAFLRNPLAWYKRYVEEIYDTPRTPASIVGSAGHLALENFYRQVSESQMSVRHSFDRANAGGKPSKKAYRGETKEIAIQKGLGYLRAISDSDIDFGKVKTRHAKKEKRAMMERDYLQAISFYLEHPPKHKVLGVEVKGVVSVEGLSLPIKAISDLVVESKIQKGAVDIVDHKFVASFSKGGATKRCSLSKRFLIITPSENFSASLCGGSSSTNAKKQKMPTAENNYGAMKLTFATPRRFRGFSPAHQRRNRGDFSTARVSAESIRYVRRRKFF